ncbi:MAG: sensor histidine kinase, partial [Phormidesmis sp.]
MYATKPQNAKPTNNLTQGNLAQGKAPIPELIESAAKSLGIHSRLSDLPRYSFSVTANYAIASLIEQFIQLPDLPGVIIVEADQVGVLSRQQFLECWLRLGHTILLGSGSVRMMLSANHRKAKSIPSGTSILLGAQQALKRPHEQQGDPILVEHNGALHLLDARVLNVAHWQIRGIETQIRYERLQMQLLQSEKMAALGQLVDGVAHEILDPVSFIWGNLGYIEDYAQQQAALICAYEAALPDESADIIQLKEDIEFDYLRSDFPAVVKSVRGGAHRLRQLVTSLQNFCHIDEVHPRPIDLNTLLEGTLRLLKSRLTSPIEIKRCYGKLPPVSGFSGQLSQVFMSIFTNAIDALLA